ncbi:MAG: hypothetical protein LBI98_01980 [Endomicrobium sp.]|jgi:hypothetical protein|nr:hypothetical protein [Endomicrobium sp.]
MNKIYEIKDVFRFDSKDFENSIQKKVGRQFYFLWHGMLLNLWWGDI